MDKVTFAVARALVCLLEDVNCEVSVIVDECFGVTLSTGTLRSGPMDRYTETRTVEVPRAA